MRPVLRCFWYFGNASLLLCPVDQLHAGIVMFYKHGAALNPIAVVNVRHVATVGDFRVVDMATYNAVVPILFCVVQTCLLITCNGLVGFWYLLF